MAVTAATFGFQKLISIRSQGLGPIKRPFKASINQNIYMVLNRRIKPKQGETPTSRSLRKLPKSGTHAKLSPRRAVLLLVPKTADGRIVRIFREKLDTFTLKLEISATGSPFLVSHVLFFSLSGEDKSCTLFCLLVT